MPPAHQGPIVLITIDALRADVLGAKLTPNLDELAAESAWAGRAVSPSSWTVPSMATLFTGLQPWASGAGRRPRRAADDLVTLPEALKAGATAPRASAPTTGWRGRTATRRDSTMFRYLREGKRAERHLRAARGPAASSSGSTSCRRTRPTCGATACSHRLDRGPPDLPQQGAPVDLEPYYDPARAAAGGAGAGLPGHVRAERRLGGRDARHACSPRCAPAASGTARCSW